MTLQQRKKLFYDNIVWGFHKPQVTYEALMQEAQSQTDETFSTWLQALSEENSLKMDINYRDYCYQEQLNKSYKKWLQIASITDVGEIIYWPDGFLTYVMGESKTVSDTIWLIFIAKYFLKHQELIRKNVTNDKNTFQFDIKELYDELIKSLQIKYTEQDCINDINIVFDFLYLLHFKDNIYDMIDTYLNFIPDTFNAIIWNNNDFTFDLEECLSLKVIQDFTERASQYIIETYPNQKCKMVYENKCLLLVDTSYESNNKQKQFSTLCKKVKDEYKISYKQIAQEIGCTYTSLIEVKNNDAQNTWNDKKIESYIEEISKRFGI